MDCRVFTELSDEVDHALKSDTYFWLDLEDPSDHKIDHLAERFGLHPLVVEDLREFGQRPRLEPFGDTLAIVFYGAAPTSTDAGEAIVHEVHMFVSGQWLITVHRGPMPDFKELQDRLEKRGLPDEQYLLYKILNSLTESFFPALDRMDDEIDDIENAIVDGATQEQLVRIITLRRSLVHLRRILSPQRDIFSSGADLITDLPGFDSGGRAYFRDVHDHLIRVSEMVDAFRDLLAGAMDLHLATVANQQGEVNKQLTVIATIFLPLTFLTGFFGQNFAYLVTDVIRSEESFWLLGMGSLLLSTVALVVYFRRKGWT